MFYDQNRTVTNKYKKVSQKKKNKLWLAETCDCCGKEKQSLISHRAVKILGKMITIVPEDKRFCTTCTDRREETIREFLKEQAT